MEAKTIGKRIGALLMTVLLVASMTMSAFAASSTKSLSQNFTYATITTGSGWTYWWRGNKTTVTVKNVGNKSVALYKNLGRIGYAYQGDLMPGQTKTFTASGGNKQYSLQFQRIYKWGTNKIQITTDYGSISWSK